MIHSTPPRMMAWIKEVCWKILLFKCIFGGNQKDTPPNLNLLVERQVKLLIGRQVTLKSRFTKFQSTFKYILKNVIILNFQLSIKQPSVQCYCT